MGVGGVAEVAEVARECEIEDAEALARGSDARLKGSRAYYGAQARFWVAFAFAMPLQS